MASNINLILLVTIGKVFDDNTPLNNDLYQSQQKSRCCQCITDKCISMMIKLYDCKQNSMTENVVIKTAKCSVIMW